MKNLNPLSRRYVLYTGLFTVIAFFWSVFNYFIQANSVKRTTEYAMMRLEYDPSYRIEYALLSEFPRMFLANMNMFTMMVCAYTGMLCLFFHLEQKQLYPGFFNALPVRKSSFFNRASSLGFSFIAFMYIINGLFTLALLYSTREITASLPDGASFSVRILNDLQLGGETWLMAIAAKGFFSRLVVNLCFYSLCLLFQQLLNKPIVAACCAALTAFVPRLFFSTADKFLYALGYKELSASLGGYSRVFFASSTSSYNIYAEDFANRDILLFILLYLALAMVFYISARRLNSKAPVYSVGLYGFSWTKPIVMCSFIICMAACCANFLPRFMNIQVMDYSWTLMLQLFVLGIAVGYYAYRKAITLLDN